MKILLSPAKIMKPVDDHGLDLSRPAFPEDTVRLLTHLQSLDYETLKQYFKVSDKVLEPVHSHYQALKEGRETELYPAILTYQGIAYQYMAPHVFTDAMLRYVDAHLLIISGLYGLVRPRDGITLYRLEMHVKIPFSLYEFWGDKLAEKIPEDELIINLASEEYAKALRKYRKLVDVRFCQDTGGKLKEKAVYAKMARGAMVRYMAEHNVLDTKGMEGFRELGFQYSREHSTPRCLVFIQDPEWKK